MSEGAIIDGEQSGIPTEQKVKAIWQEALKTPTISNEARFLDLGGDSLAAMLCISQMRELLNVEFTIEDFFMDDSTISGFAKIIDEAYLPKE
jgi:acyl carrier protein